MPTSEAKLGSLQCEQLGGEIIYVPSNWNHKVINIGISVGLAIEVGKNLSDMPKPKKGKKKMEEGKYEL